MSVRKILLDYSEYTRLLLIEKKYEDLTKKNAVAKQDQEGQGKLVMPQNISLVENTKTQNELQTPQLQMLPSITYPASANLQVPHMSKKRAKTLRGSEKKEQNDWYFLGIPKQD